MISRKLSMNFMIYFGASIFSRAIPFAVFPFLLNHLHPSDIGHLSLAQGIVLGLAPIISLSTLSVVPKYFFQGESFDDILAAVLAILSFSAAACLLLGALGVGLLQKDPTYLLTPINAYLLLIASLYLAVLRCEEKAFQYGLFEVARGLVEGCLTLALAIGLSWGWVGVLLASSGANGIAALLALVFLKRRGLVAWHPLPIVIRKILKLSIPTVPYATFTALSVPLDRFILLSYVGVFAVSEYAVVLQMSALFSIVTQAFNQVWSPIAFKFLSQDKPGWEAYLKRVTPLGLGLMLAFLPVCGLELCLQAWLVPDIYDRAAQGIPLLTAAYLFNGFYMLAFPVLISYERTSIMSVLAPLNLTVILGLSYVLVPNLGSKGMALCVMSASAATALGVWWYAKILLSSTEVTLREQRTNPSALE